MKVVPLGGKPQKKLVIFLAGIVVLIFSLGVFISSVNIIQDGTVGVVRRFGHITETITPGGLNVRLAFIHDVEVFDIRVREANMIFSAYSIDAQNIQGQISIQYRINPASVQYIAREFGTLEQLESMIHAMFNQQILNSISARTATYLIENIYQIEGEVMNRLLPNAPNFHITITNIALEGLQFSQAFRQAVDARIVAREFQEQTRIEIETDRMRAELQRDVARLEGEALVIAAQADADSIAVMMEVWDELTPEVREIMLRQLAIETWDGSLPRVIAGDDGFSLILDNF